MYLAYILEIIMRSTKQPDNHVSSYWLFNFMSNTVILRYVIFSKTIVNNKLWSGILLTLISIQTLEPVERNQSPQFRHSSSCRHVF